MGKSTKALPASVQYGALPYRLTKLGSLEVLLITTRRSKRWIIPKGDPIKGLKPAKAAAREALEEAGVEGAVFEKAIGTFRFRKMTDAGPGVLCQVQVFPLRVRSQLRDWPEAAQRKTRWFAPDEACDVMNDEGLCEIIKHFAAKMRSKAARGKKSPERESLAALTAG